MCFCIHRLNKAVQKWYTTYCWGKQELYSRVLRFLTLLGFPFVRFGTLVSSFTIRFRLVLAWTKRQGQQSGWVIWYQDWIRSDLFPGFTCLVELCFVPWLVPPWLCVFPFYFDIIPLLCLWMKMRSTTVLSGSFLLSTLRSHFMRQRGAIFICKWDTAKYPMGTEHLLNVPNGPSTNGNRNTGPCCNHHKIN